MERPKGYWSEVVVYLYMYAPSYCYKDISAQGETGFRTKTIKLNLYVFISFRKG